MENEKKTFIDPNEVGKLRFLPTIEIERGITITNVDEIEEIAWQVFQDRLGLSFRRPLFPEEIKEITSKKEFQVYRDEAIKIYEKRQLKKQKSLLNKKYPIIDVPSSGERRWMGGAYTLCFVYSKYNGNFVLRGYMKEVEDYLKKNYTHYFYNLSLWHKGFNRDIWGFWKDGVHIFTPSYRSRSKHNRNKFEIGEYGDSYLSDEENEKRRENRLYFKRLPKKWIPEFDTL